MDHNLPTIKLPCGPRAYFDISSEISYRCELCNAVVGSIGQPQSCKDEAQKYENWKKLGGKDWDYFGEDDVLQDDYIRKSE